MVKRRDFLKEQNCIDYLPESHEIDDTGAIVSFNTPEVVIDSVEEIEVEDFSLTVDWSMEPEKKDDEVNFVKENTLMAGY